MNLKTPVHCPACGAQGKPAIPKVACEHMKVTRPRSLKEIKADILAICEKLDAGTFVGSVRDATTPLLHEMEWRQEIERDKRAQRKRRKENP